MKPMNQKQTEQSNNKPKLLAFSGSLKQTSWNHKLVEVAAEQARAQGADVTVIRLSDYPLPLFNEEIEGNENSALNDLRALFSQADGLLIASPEYNGSLTGALKNLLDWISRPAQSVNYTPQYSQQVAAILSASPGGLGGIRGLSHLREILTNLGTIVIPSQVSVPAAFEAFDDEGKLKNQVSQDRVEALTSRLIEIIKK